MSSRLLDDQYHSDPPQAMTSTNANPNAETCEGKSDAEARALQVLAEV